MIPMRELVSHSIGGGWGEELRADGTEQVAIIRGADFPRVAVGDASGVPRRWESVSKLPQRTLQPGDILLEGSGGTSDRPTGRTVFISEQLLNLFDVPVIPASFCRLVRIDPALADPHYVYWWLQGMYADGRTWGYQNRSTGIANFQFQHFLDAEKVRLPIPEEQRSIAATLGALDDKIESNRRAITALEALGEAILKAALDLDVYGFPNYVRDKRVGDMVSVVETGSRPKGGTVASTFGVVSLGAESIQSAGVMSTKTFKRVPRDFADSMRRGKLVDGDVLVYKDGGSPGNFTPHVSAFGYGFPAAEATINEHVYRVRAVDTISQGLLYWLLGSSWMDGEMRKRGTGVAIPGLNSSNFKDLPWPEMSDALVQKLNASLDPLLRRILGLGAESLRLASLRDALLPELLSGRVRVPVEGIEV